MNMRILSPRFLCIDWFSRRSSFNDRFIFYVMKGKKSSKVSNRTVSVSPDDLDEVVGLQRGPSDESAVDVFLRKEYLSITGFYAASV